MCDQVETKIPKGRGRGISYIEPCKLCVCTRPSKIIICSVCGFSMRGRLRRNCSVHPLTLFLMDIDRCPHCKAYSFMMQEIESP